jgi:hypothetical protein
MLYRCTTYKTVFSSCAFIRLAHDTGTLNLSCAKVQLAAGKHGNQEVLLVAHELGMPLSDAVLRGAALAGAVRTLGWLHTEQHCQLPDDMCASAAKSGGVEVLTWLQQQGAVFNAATSLSAAEGGQLQALQFLHTQGCVIEPRRVCHAAALRGDIPMLQFLHSISCLTIDSLVLIYAARDGSVELMQWLQDHGAAVSQMTLLYAITYGHLPLCQHLLAAGCTLTEHAVQAATSRLDMLQWALAEGAQLNVGVMRAAAWHASDLELCQYLRSAGCPWDDTVVGRDLAVVQWLVNNGCPQHHRSSGIAAAQAPHGTELLMHLQQQGAVWSAADLTDMLQAGGAHFRLDIPQWLRQQGAQWPAVLRYENRPWPAAAVEWARAEGCTAPLH